MARPAAFTKTAILDSARDIAAFAGPSALSIAAVGQKLGAPTGSIYHRFKSRDELLATVWLDAIETFQAAVFDEVANGCGPAELAAFVVRWCRDNHTLAKLLTLYRRSEWLGDRVGKDVRKRAEELNVPVRAMIEEGAERWLGERTPRACDVVQLVVITLPSAGVKEWLHRDQQVPEWVAPAVQAAAHAFMKEAMI